MLQAIFGKITRQNTSKIDRVKVYVRERYIREKIELFITNDRYAKFINSVRNKLEFKLVSGIFHKNGMFIDLIYSEEFLKVYYGAQTSEMLIMLKNWLKSLLEIKDVEVPVSKNSS